MNKAFDKFILPKVIPFFSNFLYNFAESSTSTEIEEDDDEELTTKTSPYHLLGAVCFVSAIVIGISTNSPSFALT